MTPADIRRLLLLATLWGGSFLFIRIAVPVLGPVVTVETRVVLAGLALLAYALLTKAPLKLRAYAGPYLVVGVLNSAVPFLLISTAELRLTASMAAILNATSPLFGAIFAAIWLRDPLTVRKIIGIVIAIIGVAVLVGWSPLALTREVWLSIGASLLAASFYGLAGVYTKSKLKGAPPIGMAVGSQLGAGLLLAGAVPFAPIHTMPSPLVIACMLTLALVSTAVAYVLYFRLIVDVGPTNALTVTFLTPILGVVWARLLLHEPLSISKLAACVIILLGTGFVTGIVPSFRTRIPRKT
ncbi:MAG: EamA/RhaT family transporter [Chthonomonadaceae bacterium]|nr:EamA/RhaT family transporter [Chthonomonadaceae bacterium]